MLGQFFTTAPIGFRIDSMSDYVITTSPPVILTIVLTRPASAVESVQIPIVGTGIVSATDGEVDALSTLRVRVAADAANLRADLGLGNSATRNVGTTAGTVAAGDDSRFGAVQVFSGHYAGGPPPDVPTTSAAIAYDLDLDRNIWVWTGSAWA